MNPYVYDIIYTLAFVVYVPLFLGKSLVKRKSFANLKERLGFLHPVGKTDGKTIWIHAVSVGEFLSIRKLVELIKKRSPEWNIVISTITPTAFSLAQGAFGNECYVFYFPFDWSFSVKKAIRKINPDLILLMESEFWPNFLYFCKKYNKLVITANGRISQKALSGYKHLRKFFLNRLSAIRLFCMQSHIDADRLKQLGVEENRIKVSGNMKFDVKPAENKEVLNLLEAWKDNCPCILASSTMKGEEELLLDVYSELRNDFKELKLVIAPRNPERFDEVAQIIRNKVFSMCRRTSNKVEPAEIFLLDTIGELPSLHQIATVVIIGGSIKPFGGHNLIEAAYFKKPIIVGEFMENFADIVSFFLKNNACVQVSYPELSACLKKLLTDQELRNELGCNAFKVIENNIGATELIYNTIMDLIKDI